MDMVDEANPEKFLRACGERWKDTIVSPELHDSSPLQASHANDGQQQNSRSGHHPTYGVKGEKTWTLGAQPASQSRNQFGRRLFFCNSISYQLFCSSATFKNPDAFRA